MASLIMVSCWDKWGYEDECWMKKPKTIVPPVSLRSSFLLPLLYLHLVPSGATWDLVLKVRKSKSIYTCVQPIHWFWPYLLNCLFMTVTQWLFHDSYNVHKCKIEPKCKSIAYLRNKCIEDLEGEGGVSGPWLVHREILPWASAKNACLCCHEM